MPKELAELFPLNSVLVVGAGTMGSQIAQWFCQQGVMVEITDHNSEILSLSTEKVFSSWKKLQDKGKITSSQVEKFQNSFRPVKWIDKSLDPFLVVEAIIEDQKIKCELFSELDKTLHPNSIFASNTSSLPITLLAKSVGRERRKRFLGLHFFNPATILPLVEMIKTPWSCEKILLPMQKWLEHNKKIVALCRDQSGFIVNRVARNYYGEALRIVSQRDREHMREVDTILREVGGFKMGAFELMDLIGIDVNFSVTETLWQAFYQEKRFAPHPLQKQMVDSGLLGRKTGEGFYQYDQNK